MHGGNTHQKLGDESGHGRKENPGRKHERTHFGQKTTHHRQDHGYHCIGQEALAHSAPHALHAGGKLGGGRGVIRILGQQHLAALNQCNHASADHQAVTHVGEGQLAGVKALAEDVGDKGDGMAKQGKAEAVGFDHTNHNTAHAQAGHGGKVAEPGHAQQVHGDAGHLAHSAHCHAYQQQDRPLALADHGQDGLGGGHPWRPRALCGEHGGVKTLVEDGGVDNGGQGDADEHGHHQVVPAQDIGHADGQQHAVGNGKGGAGNGGLDQILTVYAAELLKQCDGNAGNQNGEQRAHQRGVGGGAGVDNQLHANDTAQHTHDDAEDQHRGLPELGMLLDGNSQLFIVLLVFLHGFSSFDLALL